MNPSGEELERERKKEREEDEIESYMTTKPLDLFNQKVLILI